MESNSQPLIFFYDATPGVEHGPEWDGFKPIRPKDTKTIAAAAHAVRSCTDGLLAVSGTKFMTVRQARSLLGVNWFTRDKDAAFTPETLAKYLANTGNLDWEHTVEVIRETVKSTPDHQSLAEVAARLNAQGYRNKQGEKLSPENIWYWSAPRAGKGRQKPLEAWAETQAAIELRALVAAPGACLVAISEYAAEQNYLGPNNGVLLPSRLSQIVKRLGWANTLKRGRKRDASSARARKESGKAAQAATAAESPAAMAAQNHGHGND